MLTRLISHTSFVKTFKFFSKSRRLIIAFIIAISGFGFIERPQASTDPVTRLETGIAMERIIKNLDRSFMESALLPSPSLDDYLDLHSSTRKKIESVLKLNLMRSYPNRLFYPDEKMRLGEVLFCWSKLLNYLLTTSDLSLPEISIENKLPPQWEVVPIEIIRPLFHVGVFGRKGIFANKYFYSVAQQEDLKFLFQTTLEYFQRDHIVLFNNGTDIKVWIKNLTERVTERELGSWTFQIDISAPQEIPQSMRIPIHFSYETIALTFYHPKYHPVTIEVSQNDHGPIFGVLHLKNSFFENFNNNESNYSALQCDHSNCHQITNSYRECIYKEAVSSRMQQKLTISGFVLDAISKNPIPNAAVVIEQKTVLTDKTGYFSLSEVFNGTVLDIWISAPKYQGISFKRNFSKEKASDLKILLNPLRSQLSGRVVSSMTGEPIIGAEIKINGKKFTTDHNGNFKTDKIYPGYYNVTLSAQGFRTSQELIFIAETPSFRYLKLQPAF